MPCNNVLHLSCVLGLDDCPNRVMQHWNQYGQLLGKVMVTGSAATTFHSSYRDRHH